MRRDELLAKLRANEVSTTEAVELNDILIEEQRAAQERNDTVALIAITLGLIVLAPKLARRGMNWQLIKQVGMKILAAIIGIVGGIALTVILRKISDHREAKQKEYERRTSKCTRH